MIAFNAHFDGKVIVPDHAVDLPRDRSFVVHVETDGSPVEHDHYLYRMTPTQTQMRYAFLLPGPTKIGA